MLKRNPRNITTAIMFCALFYLGLSQCLQCLAQDAFSPPEFSQPNFSPIKTINPDAESQPQAELYVDLNQSRDNSKLINLNENDTFYHFVSATDRFVQCNVRASWNDFKALIENAPDNDFVYISLANKMSDLGLFDLANMATLKIKDKEISNVSIDAMKRYYYPSRKLKQDDELALAEIYSNIIYNNQSSEATNELLKNEAFLSNYDYANYLVALGSYKSGLFSRAAKYINIAIIQNPTNLNYQKLKAQILAEGPEPEEAIKVVDNLKKQKLYSYEYERKIKSLEQFILYKIAKSEWEKDYHLGYYYYLENDMSKAARTLESALSYKRKTNEGLVYALLGEVYLGMNEFEKASDVAKKAYKINRNNPKTLVTLGDLSFRDKNYKLALDYYKKAAAQDKKSYTPLIKEAETYQKLSNTKKAKEIYTKVLKTHSDSWEAYYNVALLDKDTNQDKELIYLKKAIAINPLFEAGWVDLARDEIGRGNYNIAQKYLSNAFCIDENDFRYYYYQGLVNKNSGDYTQAEYNLKKCLKLNSNFKDAQDELNALMYIHDNQTGRSSI